MASSTASVFTGNERFEINRRIGAGGMGVVYEAYDREHRARVALKTLPRVDPESLYLFKQEFRNLVGIVHPNIAMLHELFSVDDTWFFTMDFVEGTELLDYIRFGGPDPNAIEESDQQAAYDPTVARGPRSEAVRDADAPLRTQEQYERLRSSLRQLAEAIQALHSCGKLHRDIKPSNVMVTASGHTVLLDFGLSIGLRDSPDLPFEERFAGSPAYMAPEQRVGGILTPATDWFALGAILHEALTGTLFTTDDRRDPSGSGPLDALATDVPEDLVRLCRDLLVAEPEKRPSAPEILLRLGGRESVPTSDDETVFVGRTAQLGVLHDALATMRDHGKTMAIFVHGSSGEGKSFLVEQFLANVERQPETVVLRGRCYEAESVPYKALDSLIDGLSRYLARRPDLAAVLIPRDAWLLTRVFPVLRNVGALNQARERATDRPSEQELRRRAIRSLRDLLARLGERVQLVLCIDDLQWGDRDSALLLSELLDGADPPVLCLVGVYRSEYRESAPMLRMLTESWSKPTMQAERREIAVGALTEDEARSLAMRLLGGREAEAAIIARESGGVPFFVHELVSFVRDGAVLETGAKGVSLEELIARRVRVLPAGAQRLLETIAVAGKPLVQVDACNAAALPDGTWATLSLLRTRRFVRSTGPGELDAVESYHDRIRETIMGLLDGSARAATHARLAQTLESSGRGDSETLAFHFRESAQTEKAAGFFARAAAEASQALAFDRAATLYREALRLRSAEDEEAHHLRCSLADALANAGRGYDAAQIYEALSRASSSAEETADHQRQAAYHYCVSGHVSEGRRAMTALLASHGVRLPPAGGGVLLSFLANRLRLWWRGYDFAPRAAGEVSAETLRHCDLLWSAAAGLSMIDIIAGAMLQTKALMAALDAGEPARIARSLAWEASHTSNAGSDTWPQTEKLLKMAWKVGEQSDDVHSLALTTMANGIAEFTMGRFAEAVGHLDEAEQIFRGKCTGVSWELATAHTFALWALVYSGSFSLLSRRTDTLLREAERRGDLYEVTNIGTFMLPHALLAAGDAPGARAAVNHARDAWPDDAFYLQHLTGVMSETMIDLYEGDPASAHERLLRTWPSMKSAQLFRIQVLRIMLQHFRARSALELALRAPDPERLLRLVAADAKRIEKEPVAWAVPLAQALRAGVASQRGDARTAESLLREAALRFDGVAMRSYAASARLTLAKLTHDDAAMAEAAQWMAAEGVREAVPFARMHIAGVYAG